MKRLLLTSVLVLIAIAVSAQARMVVWEKGGNKVVYQLSDQPTTTFENGKLTISTNSASVSYHLENVLRYTYEGVENKPVNGIEQLSEEVQVTIDHSGQSVSFKNLQPGTAVNLYGLNGMLIDTQRADGNGSASLSVSHRPTGVYVVKTGKQTIKLTRP